MKKLKKITAIITAVLMIAVVSLTIINTATQNSSGNFSAACGRITDRGKRWVIENFGSYETVEELLVAIDVYGMKEFTYDDSDYEFIQWFDFDQFVFQRDFNGLCFDFACFSKCTALVWAEAKNVDLKCYIYDVKTKSGTPHSYNYFVHGDKTYYMDVTHDNTQYKKGKTDKIYGPIETKGRTPKEFSTKVLGDKIIIKR